MKIAGNISPVWEREANVVEPAAASIALAFTVYDHETVDLGATNI